jgi:hypothetical protein
MMDKPTICAECEFCNKSSCLWDTWYCLVNPEIDFVSGDKTIVYCRNKNTDGKCPDFKFNLHNFLEKENR